MKTQFLKIFAILVSVFFISIAFIGCIPDDDDDDDIDPGHVTTPWSFPDKMPSYVNVPDHNPMTVEGIKLGRYLFYDGRLSGRTECDSQMSCATCHLQEKGFDLGMGHPKFQSGHPYGLTGVLTPHFPLPLVNLAYNHTGYLWNGFIYKDNPNLGVKPYGIPAQEPYNLKNIESLVWMGIVAKHEMNGTIDMSVEMIKSIKDKPNYPELFKDAFGTDEINIERISMAIAQFVRSIVSYNSKFHKYIRREVQLTKQEYRGMELFMSEKADCFHCHGAYPLMTTNEFYNNALDSVFNDPRDRFGVTKDPMDKGAYKATSLINCELYGPYMHDGRFKTLREVIDHYSDHLVNSPSVDPLMEWVYYGGTQLTEDEKDDLEAFLKTLTDHTLLTDPQYKRPVDLETGCPE